MTGDIYGKWGPQSGPCVMCGAVNYPMSMGGSGICPSCDCGNFGPKIVQRQGKEIASLREELAAAKAALSLDNTSQHRSAVVFAEHELRKAVSSLPQGNNNG